MDDQYEDNQYDDDDYDYDHPSLNPYQWFFKFDIGQNSPLSSWISDIINNVMQNDYDTENIPGFPVKKFPVNSWNPNTVNDKKFQYLGSNYAGEQIWKTKYWIQEPLNQEYKLHLQSNAAHFIQQPKYYKSMFDILN